MLPGGWQGKTHFTPSARRAAWKLRHTLHPVAADVDCQDVLSLLEFEELARQSMTPMAYEFVASGAADEHTLRWNREAFNRDSSSSASAPGGRDR